MRENFALAAQGISSKINSSSELAFSIKGFVEVASLVLWQ
jgi:hypothetical protein